MGEMAGGLLLAAGFLTPLAGAALISVMVVATVSAHWQKGFFAHSGGFEYTLVLAASALALAFTGPGAISFDRALGISWSGSGWGLAALLLGLLGGTGALLARKSAPAATKAQQAA